MGKENNIHGQNFFVYNHYPLKNTEIVTWETTIAKWPKIPYVSLPPNVCATFFFMSHNHHTDTLEDTNSSQSAASGILTNQCFTTQEAKIKYWLNSFLHVVICVFLWDDMKKIIPNRLPTRE